MGTQLEIAVDGVWLSTVMLYGDVEMSTCWPGGSDQLSWTPHGQAPRRFSGGEPVVGYYGGVPRWAGSLIEPDASQEQLTARGAWYEADEYAALDATNNRTFVPDTAIDQAIARGLNWTRPASISAAAASTATDNVMMLSELMQVYADNSGTIRWGVNPLRQVYSTTDPDHSTYMTLPMAGGLGYALDDYASTLVGRFLNASSVYSTVVRTDATAEALHGHKEATVDLTGRGNLTITAAGNILINMLALYRTTPQWTSPLELVYGELLSMGGVPVPLEMVSAGQMIRVMGGYELAQRLNGVMYLDVLIGGTNLANGTLTITPMQMAARSLTDVLALALKRRPVL